MKKTFFNKAVCIILIAAVMSLLLIRAFWINQVFPPIHSVQIPRGEHCVYNGFDMTASSFEIYRLDELFQMDNMQELDRSYYTSLGPLSDSYALFAKLKVKNNNSTEASIPLYELSLTDGVWHNDFNLSLFQILNADTSIIQTMEQGEEITVILPYILTKAQFTSARWNQVESKRYYLDVAVYPEHISLSM